MNSQHRSASLFLSLAFVLASLLTFASPLAAQTSTQVASPQDPRPVKLGDYLYETRPDDPAFDKYNLAKAPKPGSMMLRPGDRLAIIGDSITEQKIYSRMIETYLTVTHPQLEVTVRQYGWSGEKTDGLLRRLDQDVLRFHPTIATLSYGMNDARYRPYDVTNGRWYRDHYTEIVRRLKAVDARVVLGSPGCCGKLASWVKSRRGTLDELNLNLASLRDIGIDIARDEDIAFADIFWPMFQAQIFAPRNYGTEDHPYEVAGKDGVHPGQAGHVIMAYGFLRAMGIDGDLGTLAIDLANQTASSGAHHLLQSSGDNAFTFTSDRFPYCATGPLDQADSIRSGMTLIPFHEDLNRFVLKVTGIEAKTATVTWGEVSQDFSADALEKGILLAKEFPVNPFSPTFKAVDQAVAEKQAFETNQIKGLFHGPVGKADIEAVIKTTEAQRQPLVAKIKAAMKPVTHTIRISQP